jgi:hypothetical protein
MTTPVERKNAVIYTEKFLLELLRDQTLPDEVRERARSLLRHYPSEMYMDLIAEREDSTNVLCGKVFGNSWI